ncbi:alpha/beta hydrolase [Salinicoccus albus]|uniref:alpha/beta hydrolase n=1 Tax=Salinicoccus albus TaxID=418756 RepID=UPI00037DAF0F|nr:alpha/beta hydrolase [Salinicoccus albus]
MSYFKNLESADGTMLNAKINEVEAGLGTVIIVHGLAEHLDRYDHVAHSFMLHDFNVVRFDHRGHGRSGGRDVYYNAMDDIAEDVKAAVGFVKKTFTGKVFLVGHSMGGYAVTLYGSKYPGTVDAYITSGALTRYNTKLFAGVDQSLNDEDYFTNSIGEGLCSIESVVEEYQKDALIKQQISVGLTRRVLEGVEYLKEKPKNFVDPVLILHGADDGLVSPDDSLEFYQEISSELKSLFIYAGLQHEIFNEMHAYENISNEMISWLKSFID